MEIDSTTLKNGGVLVIATDTIYGIVGQALKKETVERIYQLKKRTPTKPCIILISDYADIEKFGIHIDDFTRSKLDQYWPGPVSIILDCSNDTFAYLHRGSHSLAFRMPAKRELRDLISQTGPLIAPSANPEGLDPARTIKEAREYFGDTVDGYIAGTTIDKASTIIQLQDGKEVIIRP